MVSGDAEGGSASGTYGAAILPWTLARPPRPRKNVHADTTTSEPTAARSAASTAPESKSGAARRAAAWPEPDPGGWCTAESAGGRGHRWNRTAAGGTPSRAATAAAWTRWASNRKSGR